MLLVLLVIRRHRRTVNRGPMSPWAYRLFRAACALYTLLWLIAAYFLNTHFGAVAQFGLDALLLVMLPTIDMFHSYERYLEWWSRQPHSLDDYSHPTERP